MPFFRSARRWSPAIRLLIEINILEVVRHCLGKSLVKKGKGYSERYLTLCPFHNEATASFAVVPRLKQYNCLGCGAHGNAIKFVMEYAHLSFEDAVAQVSTITGIKVPHGPTNLARARRRSRDRRRRLLAQRNRRAQAKREQANLKNEVARARERTQREVTTRKQDADDDIPFWP